jgi:hypothetical protein
MWNVAPGSAGGVICSGRWHAGKITGMKMRDSHKKITWCDPLYFSPRARAQGHPEGALARARRASHPRRSSELRLATPFLSSPLLRPSGLSLFPPGAGYYELYASGSVTHRKLSSCREQGGQETGAPVGDQSEARNQVPEGRRAP